MYKHFILTPELPFVFDTKLKPNFLLLYIAQFLLLYFLHIFVFYVFHEDLWNLGWGGKQIGGVFTDFNLLLQS